ncbi:hypothetical protein Glove_271g40 [Diversispora epigaea]|uniref:BTB domain-containing protein n=1 Tax=Diversispora epigaea TaxID=1348612 RepID=A0A397I452_9GLOM|nr:hypothetical protein Glove_271g40 [Diversispora epigaea]
MSFIELLNDKADYNVIVEVENEKSFTAHSNVLKCRSPYFRKELENIIPNENNIKKITKPNISEVIFDIILKYIYSGIIKFENVETRFIFDLMIAANEFEIEELTKKLEILLIETKSSWLKSHFSLVYRSIFNGNSFENLGKFYCNDIVAKYPNLIFDAEDFVSLQEPALVSLLKRDDLQLEEVIIWEYIIKWGIGQNSTLPVDLKEWNDENFTTLKTTLQQCLPLIRYFHIPSTDVLKKIKPYKKILDEQLWEDLNHFENLGKFYCNDIVAKYPNLIFDAEDFVSLQEPALVSLLKRDDLQLEEVIIWEYIIKWGIGQNSTLPVDLKEWNDENFTTLKTTLQQCLPLIRYFHIPSTDVLKKIKPYKKILDEQLWEDLNQYFVAPDQPVESIILSPRTKIVRKLPTRTTTEQAKPVLPLKMTENRWVSVSVSNQHIKSTDEMETVQRKVKALLNKLTLEKFDSISGQIIDFANKSRDEREGRILREVTRLIFENSCDEPSFSQMYVQLCREMMERIDIEIIDENVKNADGKFIQGGTLFKKYLLNRCQEDFEKGWKVNVPLPSNEKGEPDLMSDEYYTAAKAKRYGLGLIRFIGELFKLNMLTQRIMHSCIKKLLTASSNPETPKEEETESLCTLLNTVGQRLDNKKAKTHMDTYFNRMEDISRNPKISNRIRFMLQDVIELRNKNWIPRRRDNNVPKTIAEIHEDAARQREDEFIRRTARSGGRGLPKTADQMTRVGSGRRGDKSSSGGQSLYGGWSTVSSSSSRKAGDLSKFGSVSRSKVSGPVGLAPGEVVGTFTDGSKGWKIENKDRKDKASSIAQTNSTSKYSVLTYADTERIFHPRSTTIKETNVAPKPTTTTPSPRQPLSISEEVAERKINNMIAEYFNILDIQEVILCVKDLPKEYHSKVVSSFATKVLEKKQDDVRKVIEMFDRIINEGVLSKKEFIDGLAVTIEFLIGIGVDAPKSYTYTGQLLFTAQFDLKEVMEILKPLLDDVKGTEKVMAGYIEEWKREIDEQSIARKVKDSGFDFNLIFPHSDVNKFLESLGLEDFFLISIFFRIKKLSYIVDIFHFPKLSLISIKNFDISTIITYEYVAKISLGFIVNTPNKFLLILRGSIIWFKPQTFWDTAMVEYCIDYKVKGTDEILGRYNPLSWDNTKTYDSWGNTNYNIQFLVLVKIRLILDNDSVSE